MRANSTLIFFFSFLFFATSSCKRKDFFLNIKFGLSDTLLKAEINRMIKDGEIFIEIKGDDTSYIHDINVDGNIYKTEVNFNSDNLQSGAFRCYEYSLTTLPFAQSGNDTNSKEGYRVTDWEVFKVSDFEKLKSHLDKKYGKGIFSSNEGTFGNYTTFKYETKNADLFLTHGEKQESTFWSVPIKTPFYTIAYLEIRSKTYEKDYEKERERRKEILKPDEVLSIYFDPPKIQYGEPNYSFDRNFSSNNSAIVISANLEHYKTSVIDDDIIECKGILSIIDAYNDTLLKHDLIYKFNTPLRSPNKQKWTTINKNSYTLNFNNLITEKITRQIEEGSILKTFFTPTAIVLKGGEVIK